MHVDFKYSGKFEPPKKQTQQSAGIDLFNNEEDSIKILPGKAKKIQTGAYIAIPEGFVGLLFVRSSLGFKLGATLSNSVGVIDSDYRGEIVAKVINLSEQEIEIKPGERFCQLVIIPHLCADFRLVPELDKTERGDKGFGSTGKFQKSKTVF